MSYSSQLDTPSASARGHMFGLCAFLEARAAAAGIEDAVCVEVRPDRGEGQNRGEIRVGSWGREGAFVRLVRETAVPEPLFHTLVAAWKELYDIETRETLLLEEMSVGWETLQALYDLSSDLQLSLSQDETLTRILARAAASAPGSSALLLLDRHGEMAPAAWFNTPEPGPFSLEAGLLGRLLNERQALVVNGADRIAGTAGLEPVFGGANSIALAPIATTQGGLFGVICLWSRNEKSNFTSHIVRLLEALGQQAALIVKSEQLNRTLRETERLQQELQIGSLIQKTLLLSEMPKHHPMLDLAALNIPSQTVDGDFIDVYPRSDGGLEVLVGDVMGKGIPAALIGAATKSHVLRAVAETGHAVASTAVELHPIINRAARRMTTHLQTLDRFVTLCLALIDPVNLRVQWVDCGHTATVHYHSATRQTTELKGDGLPMGVLETEVYEERIESLDPGDALLFYSDGVTEARNAEGEMYGEERLSALVRTCAELGCAVLLDTIRREVTAFTGKDTFADDFTCVAVRLLPEEERPVLTESITLGSTLSELPRLHAWCDRVLRMPEARLPEDSADMITIALTEAVTNIIRHGYKERPGGQISLSVVASASQLLFEIEDEGARWDPAGAPDPVFDGSKSGGFGLFIITEIMDRCFHLRPAEGKNRLQLVQLHDSRQSTEEKRL